MSKPKFGELAATFEEEASRHHDERVAEVSDCSPVNVGAGPAPELLASVKRDGSFDYSQLSPEDQAYLLERYATIERMNGRAAILIGTELRLAKERILTTCARGGWTDWLQLLPFSESTARNKIAASEWAEKNPTVGEMAPGAIYRGAMAPNQVKTEIIRLLEMGEIVSADDISRMIKEHKAASVSKPELDAQADNNRSKGMTETISSAQRYVDRDACVDDTDNEMASNDVVTWPTTGDASSSSETPNVPHQTRKIDNQTVGGSNLKTAFAASSESPNIPLEATEGDEPIDTKSLRAATEIVAVFREIFDDDTAIVNIVELWSVTSSATVLMVLAQTR